MFGFMKSSRRYRIVTLGAAAAALVVPLGIAGSGTAQTRPTTDYALNEPVCPKPVAGQASCFVMRRVQVTQGTPGAIPYTPGAGSSTAGPTGGLTPGDLASAYSYSPTATGSGQTVAIVDAYNDPDINSNLQAFDSYYGLSTCSTTNGCFKVVNENGGTTLPPNDTSGWSVEESLDVETVHSVCESCKIVLLEANSPSNADLGTAEDEAITLGAAEVSNSYGEPESGADPTFQAAFDHPGVVIAASTGDDGYYDYDLLQAVDQPNFPASSPDVVAVGGTSLYLNSNGTRSSETVWNSNGPNDENGQAGASGGGCSTIFTAPTWQSTLSAWPDTACGSNRLVGDVSADADPNTGFDIYDTYGCCGIDGWATVGGTSLSSPIIASIYALAGGAHGASYPASTLYSNLGSTSLYDVTSGGNGWCDGENAATCGDPNTLGYGIVDCDYTASGALPPGDLACDAATGYDGPSGVGTPDGLGAFGTGTTSPAPSATTDAATKVASTTATLNGLVNPNGTDTHWYFEYGKTTSYGTDTPSVDAGSGTTGTPVSANIGDLLPSTTYHFQLVAYSANGTTDGGDLTLTTASSQKATKLAFSTEPPKNSPPNAKFPVAVSVETSTGAVVTSSSATVTLMISGGSPIRRLICTPANSVRATSGVASFSCSVNIAGSGYQLVALSPGLAGATSTAFTIT